MKQFYLNSSNIILNYIFEYQLLSIRAIYYKYINISYFILFIENANKL